jgi:hypothetical protein
MDKWCKDAMVTILRYTLMFCVHLFFFPLISQIFTDNFNLICAGLCNPR